LQNRAINALEKAAALDSSVKLYDANKKVYELLRYGIKEKKPPAIIKKPFG